MRRFFPPLAPTASKIRLRCGYLLVVAGVVLLLVGVLWLRGRNVLSPPETEKRVLRELEIYGAKFELDDRGSVIRLVLEGPQVTDAALDRVSELRQLQRISLAQSSVTDAGLLKLRKVKRLCAIGLTNTRVTDRGLGCLEQIPSLRYVWLCPGGKLTQRGIAALQRNLPGVKVYLMNNKTKSTARKKDP